MEYRTIESACQAWNNTFTKQPETIGHLYRDNALLYLGKGNSVAGKQGIAITHTGLRRYASEIAEIKVQFSKMAGSSSFFEMGDIRFSNSVRLKFLRIWRMSDQAWMISLEVVSHVAMQNYDLPIIDRRRQEWVAFSNSHLVNDLVTDLYANDALYFDQANIHIGRAEIITAYQYMSDPGFSINLTGLSSCQLQDDLAFELGEYSSNGTVGMYTIIWEKTHDGRWHIALDSNT